MYRDFISNTCKFHCFLLPVRGGSESVLAMSTNRLLQQLLMTKDELGVGCPMPSTAESNLIQVICNNDLGRDSFRNNSQRSSPKYRLYANLKC